MSFYLALYQLSNVALHSTVIHNHEKTLRKVVAGNENLQPKNI